MLTEFPVFALNEDYMKALGFIIQNKIDQIKIILACEKTFDVHLKPREISAMENIGDMVDHLYTLLSN